MDLTLILQRAENGDNDARADAIQAAYKELRSLAASQMNRERLDHTLSSTALVHEVAIKLLDDDNVPTRNRGSFFAYAARAMRNYLIDYARTRGRQKRGGDCEVLSLDQALVASQEQSEELLALNEALDRLAEIDSRKAQVVEMRYFGGLSNKEIAEALNISVASVKRDWNVAKAWFIKRYDNGSEATTVVDSGVAAAV